MLTFYVDRKDSKGELKIDERGYRLFLNEVISLNTSCVMRGRNGN